MGPDAMPEPLVRRHPWAWKFNAPLPYAYVLPKAKKSYLAARSIISYTNTPLGPALRYAARVLADISFIAFPQGFDRGSAVSCWKAIHALFAV